MGSGITRTVCILSSTTNWICTELPRHVCTYAAVDRRTASAYPTEFVTGTFLAGEAMSTGGSTRAPDRWPCALSKRRRRLLRARLDARVWRPDRDREPNGNALDQKL